MLSINLFKEVTMKLALAAVFVVLSGSVALAVVGGGDITLNNKGGDTVFSHENHVEGAGLKCQECHAKLYTNVKQHKAVTMKAMEQGKSCGACHDGKTAFSVKENCESCHKK
jgi:c(7)-type cytochrome triheme protein